jgi:DinB superfamily
MPKKKIDARIELLLELLDQSFIKKAWHGTTLRGALRGMSVKQALWRPKKGRHNIWEEILHTAYWKYAVRRRITEDTNASFPRKGSDWPPLPKVCDEKAWKKDIAMMIDMHKRLMDAVLNLPPSKLNYVPKMATNVPNRITIFGIAQHDVYHAGQIQMLKRLQRP